MRAPVEGRDQRDGDAVVRSRDYRSDSNQHWRSGCPHEELRAARSPAAAADAPGDLGYPGRDDGRDDARDARRGERAAARAARRRPDRPLVRGRHRPRLRLRLARHGGARCAALRENGEREIRLVGTDMSERVGRPPSLRRVPPRPGRLRPRLRRRGARGRRARGRRRRCSRSRRSTSRASPQRTATAFRMPVLVSSPTRSTARTTRPRPTRCCTGWA